MKKEEIMQIRKITKEDLPLRVKWMNHPKVYPNMNYVIPILMENTYKWYEKIINNPNRFDAAFIDDNGQLIGFGGLTNIDKEVAKAEFYLFLGPDYQHKGLGTIAASILCRYGFDILLLHKIFLFANASNIPACHTYEKIGFKLEGVHRQEKIIDKRYEDRLYYGMFVEELKY